MAQNSVDYSQNPTGPNLMDQFLAKEQENRLTSDSGIIRPSYAVAGTVWLDTSISNVLTYKLYDGTNDIVLFSIDKTTGNVLSYVSQDTYYKNGIPYWDVNQIGKYTNITVVARIVDGEFNLYKNKTGNASTTPPESDETNWERLSLGDGGLEIGDIGFAPFGIDETKNKRRYLNGQLIGQSQFQTFTKKLKAAVALYPSLAVTETEWRNELNSSKLGQCGKFVIDDNVGTIRLPKVYNIEGTRLLSNIGRIRNQSLPNATGNLVDFLHSTYAADSDGVFSTAYNPASVVSPGKDIAYDTVNFSLANSNPTYQNNAPVQEEAVEYPYFIQVATGNEENIDVSTEIQLNNPFFFGMSHYFPSAPENASWIKSDGQFKNGTTYSSFYQWLLQIYNGSLTVAGVSVKASTANDITEYDYVINTSDTTFKLPTLNGSENLPTGEVVSQSKPAAGDNTYYIIPYNCFVEAQWNNCSQSRIWDNTKRRDNWLQNNFAGFVGRTLFMPKGHQLGVFYSDDGTFEIFNYIKAAGNGSLYYYIGETVQDANLIVATGILNEIQDKKKIGYEQYREIECNGAVTVKLQDDDEIIVLRVENNTTITFDLSELTYPKNAYTVQIYIYFINGAKTISLIASKSIAWINGNVPDFSSAKAHYVVIRHYVNDAFILMSDAGEVG